MPPKLALPIIENASLEENDELQDLWANLLASAVDPSFDGVLRSAFIEIAKHLEVIDVHILNFVHQGYNESLKEWSRLNNFFPSPTFFPVHRMFIIEKLGIDESTYENSIDNLIRLRCIASYIEKKTIESDSRHYINLTTYSEVTYDHH